MKNDTKRQARAYETPFCQSLSVETADILCQSFGSTTEAFNVDDTQFNW